MMCKNGILNKSICGVIIGVLASVSNAPAANVVQRDTVTSGSRVSTTRPTMAARRMPTMTTNVTTSETSTSTTPAETEKTETVVEEVVEESSVENKSSQFGSSLSSKSTSEHDTAAATLAELVRAQRAALDAQDANAVAAAMATDLSGNGESTCDTVLRECMMQKCGANFGKCFADTDTTFFDKMDTCRRTTNCTGHEYQLFSVEIKADRDLNAKLATYNATIDCGNSYDDCIVSQCGTTYSKCIGKSAGDTAIAKCDSIAKSCIEYDSGLAMRAMAVFGELRQNAERQIAADELKLYDLREEMRSLCTRLGAMFDERSLDCVYTVNFRADNNGESTLYASKKAYAGSTFDCTPNWFGIDITTFRENAFRATREQSSASSALLGSGLGVATGALTSGAVGRAIDRHTADRALDKALAECMQYYTESECRAKIKTTKPAKADNTGSDGAGIGNLANELGAAAGAAGNPQPNGNTPTGDGANAGVGADAGAAGDGNSDELTDNGDSNTGGNANAKPADESSEPEAETKTSWHPLTGNMFAYLGTGIHQPGTADEYQDQIDTVKDICTRNGGEFKIYPDTPLNDPHNTYGNTYIRYVCEFEKPDNSRSSMRCKNIFYKNYTPANGNDYVTPNIHGTQGFSAKYTTLSDDDLKEKIKKENLNYDACEFLFGSDGTNKQIDLAK